MLCNSHAKKIILQTNSDFVLKEHIISDHKKGNKRSISSFKCSVVICESTFNSERKLKDHEVDQHQISDENNCSSNEIISPTSSPPRKRLEGDSSGRDEDVTEVEMIDVEVLYILCLRLGLNNWKAL